MVKAQHRTGIVVIGRNEALRLGRGLASVLRFGVPVVYVDSGSTDGSVALASSLGVPCIELSPDQPFSAARGRNAGFEHLRTHFPHLRYVQFVDGDCELDAAWLARGEDFLDSHPEVAIAFGRLVELRPEASIYNRLCAMEWEYAPGEVEESLGIMLVRADAFSAAGGFTAGLAAGEESDFCARVMRAGHTIHCVDAPMGSHDAAMLRFSEWWTRSMRNGYGCCRTLFGRDAEFQAYDLRCLVSAFAIALALPTLALLLAWWTFGLGLLLAPLGWGLLYERVRRRRLAAGTPAPDASLYARFIVLGKFADIAGIALYAWHVVTRRNTSFAIRYRDRAAA